MFVVVRDYYDEDIMAFPKFELCKTFVDARFAVGYADNLYSDYKNENRNEDASYDLDKIGLYPSKDDCENICGLRVKPNPKYIVGEYATNCFGDGYHNYYCVVEV